MRFFTYFERIIDQFETSFGVLDALDELGCLLVEVYRLFDKNIWDVSSGLPSWVKAIAKATELEEITKACCAIRLMLQLLEVQGKASITYGLWYVDVLM